MNEMKEMYSTGQVLEANCLVNTKAVISNSVCAAHCPID